MLEILNEIGSETGLDVVERLRPRPTPTSLSPLLGDVKLETKEVIQIASAEPGSRKSDLLSKWMADVLVRLPEMEILFLNLEHPSVALSKLSSNLADKKSAREAYNRRVHCIHIFDNDQFDLTLLNLPFLLASNKSVGLIAVDNIGTGYEIERYENGGLAYGRFISQRLESLLQSFAGFQIPLIFTKTEVCATRKADWDPKITLSVSLRRDRSDCIHAELETVTQKTSKKLDSNLVEM